MALDESQKKCLNKRLYAVSSNDHDSEVKLGDTNLRKCENVSFQYVKKQGEIFCSSKKSMDDSVCCKYGDRKLNDFVDCNASDRNADDINQSSDSLSSSASISDSDFTSTDSDDSLALSESESITDVTPLNSPYCDSPLPQNRHIDVKSEDKNITNPCRSVDYEGSCGNCRPEMNVLMKAIEKLELEAKNNSELGYRETMMRRRAASFSNEESKKIEQENQRLFKRVISQQNRIRSMYSASNPPSSKNIACKNEEMVKSDGDSSGTPRKSIGAKFLKQGDKAHTRRRQKCLSHPSSYMYPHNHLTDKSLLTDCLPSEESGRKKSANASVMKIANPKAIEKSCEEVIANSIEIN